MSYFTCIIEMLIFFLHLPQAKAEEEKLKKCGEDEKTVPPEYRLKPATVRCLPRCLTAAHSSCLRIAFCPVCPHDA